MTDLKSWINNYYQARNAYEAAKEESTRLYHAMQSAEVSLVDAMVDEGVAKVDLDDGTSVGLRKQFTISVTKANMHDIRDWLLSSIGDDMQFVEEVVSKPALTSYLRENPDMEVPDFLNLNTRPAISVRGWSTRPR